MKILLSGGTLGQLPQEVKSMSKIIMTVFFMIILVPVMRRMLPTIELALRDAAGGVAETCRPRWGKVAPQICVVQDPQRGGMPRGRGRGV